jgi:hypothetical protein
MIWNKEGHVLNMSKLVVLCHDTASHNFSQDSEKNCLIWVCTYSCKEVRVSEQKIMGKVVLMINY